MPDYVRMTVLTSYEETDDLVSEALSDRSIAEQFSVCFAHNYNCSTKVSETTDGKDFVVFAYKVSKRLSFPNIDHYSKSGFFANWIFEGRRFQGGAL